MHSYEKLGAFYIGRVHDPDTKQTSDEPLLYDSKDLLTHAVCVGMTGSGKTGLCVGLLEEAAIDGIPVIAIDPKGDLTNLLLTFPDLDAASFRPWINEDEANQKGVTPEVFAAQQAQLWKNGLAKWDQDGERIARLRESADFAVYTPGSDAGIPVSVLSSFDAPPRELCEDSDLLGERVSAVVTSLLSLLGIDADPLRSREHILLSNILQESWKNGRSVRLAELIQMIQQPGIGRIGVLDLESFYPSKDRFELAMLLNNLLASPRFQAWLEGDPLDVDQFLYTSSGKPRVSVFSIAHLDEAERMFFVALLLNQMVGWMRSRSGTTSLRAVLYMDEIFGFMPPVANPPAKKPLLTMLKQARAYGLGLVLATQNPVDLDYKGLSNAGTWFIGRLQTERDKQRILDGLKGVASDAGGVFNVDELEETINRLDKRVFLLHNVHEPHPVVFQTRWAMSYLAGPITREQIKLLMGERRRAIAPAATRGASQTPTATASPTSPVATAMSQGPPVLPPGIPQGFLAAASPTAGGRVVYEPCLLGVADVHFNQRGKGTVHSKPIALVAPLVDDAVDLEWQSAEEIDPNAVTVDKRPIAPASFSTLPPPAAKETNYRRWQKELVDSLYRNQSLFRFQSERFGVTSEIGESERDFRIRLAEAARERRDEMADTLRKKYETKSRRLDERVRRAEQAVGREAEQATTAKMQTAVSFGATILSAFLGRKTMSRTTLGRATTAARGVGRSTQQASDVKRAKETLAALLRERDELSREFEDEVDRLEKRCDPETEPLTSVALKPRKTDVDVKRLTLAWRPFVITELGERKSLWP